MKRGSSARGRHTLMGVDTTLQCSDGGDGAYIHWHVLHVCGVADSSDTQESAGVGALTGHLKKTSGNREESTRILVSKIHYPVKKDIPQNPSESILLVPPPWRVGGATDDGVLIPCPVSAWARQAPPMVATRVMRSERHSECKI